MYYSYPLLIGPACRGLVMPGATAWVYDPLPNSSIEQDVWWSVLLDIYDVTKWRHIHVCKPLFWRSLLTQHAYYSTCTLLTRCYTMCPLSALQVRKQGQNPALSAKTEQFITAKISGNALKQGSRTDSALHQRSSQLQKYKAARMSRRVAVEQRRYAAGMADIQGWQFATY